MHTISPSLSSTSTIKKKRKEKKRQLIEENEQIMVTEYVSR